MQTDPRYKILLVDDDPYVLEMLSRLFEGQYQTLATSSGRESIELVRKNEDVTAVVMDIKMADMTGIAAAREIRGISPDSAIIFHTGYPGYYDEDTIDEQEKPYDYVLKGETVSRLMRSVRNAVESYRLKNDLDSNGSDSDTTFGIVGKSPAMRKVFSLIRKLIASDSKAMIYGETGTGKELVARALHYHGPRKDKKLAVLQCSRRSPELIESELFGHVRGAFTGAVSDRPGLFEYADGGTVFLDEIGDLDLSTQTKLLRVLENGEYNKLGSDKIKKTKVRVLCATHKDLEDLVNKGRFREDLYFRLKGVKIVLPPLRERREDIPLLIDMCRDRCTIEKGLAPKVFDQGAIDVMVNYNWPGNVRQLLETVESVIVLSESDLIFAREVSDYLNLSPAPEVSGDGSLKSRVRRFERTLIDQTLSQTEGNISESARILKLDRANLRKKIRTYNLDLDRYRTE